MNLSAYFQISVRMAEAIKESRAHTRQTVLLVLSGCVEKMECIGENLYWFGRDLGFDVTNNKLFYLVPQPRFGGVYIPEPFPLSDEEEELVIQESWFMPRLQEIFYSEKRSEE